MAAVVEAAQLPSQYTNSEAFQHTRNAGAFKDYLTGLDNLRNQVFKLESLVEETLTDFHSSEKSNSESSESSFNTYLRSVNDLFVHCNHALAAKGTGPIIVDGQAQIAELINYLKEYKAVVQPDTTAQLLNHWEKVKFAVEALQIVMDRFEKEVFNKLKGAGRSYYEVDGLSNDSLALIYNTEIAKYLQDQTESVNVFRLLASSSGSKIDITLIEKSTFMDSVLRYCDEETYPILQIVPALALKLEALFRISKIWMDRDEKFLFDVYDQIRERKFATRAAEDSLRAERDKHRTMLKNVRTAYLQCQNSKRKLRELATELSRLETQVYENETNLKNKVHEKHKMEDMAEFLEISITQTRKNYTLQLKRQRLLRQVKELETSFQDINQNISQMKDEMNNLSSNRQVVRQHASLAEDNYNEIKSELEGCTNKVAGMAQELRCLRASLTSLEVIQTCKISPENVDNFCERPSSVKLSASLRDKIHLKKRSAASHQGQPSESNT